MEKAYYHASRLCYPNDIDYRSRYIDIVQSRREVYPKALEALFSILLPVDTTEDS